MGLKVFCCWLSVLSLGRAHAAGVVGALELGGKLHEKGIRDIAGGGLRGLSSTSVTNVNRVPGLLDFLQHW